MFSFDQLSYNYQSSEYKKFTIYSEKSYSWDFSNSRNLNFSEIQIFFEKFFKTSNFSDTNFHYTLTIFTSI